ncbi:MAG: hemerythrin domain-containing protein [Aminipila sp.]
MWKDQYVLGVRLLDAQHKAMFDTVESWLDTLSSGCDWEKKNAECRNTLAFLKRYVVMHFNAEETYQESLNYAGVEAHKQVHNYFARLLEVHERNLESRDFDIQSVNQFTDFILKGFINHVTTEDQKITWGNTKTEYSGDISIIGSFVKSISGTMERMAGINPKSLSGKNLGGQEIKGDIFVKIGIIGDLNGYVIYGFSKEFADKILNTMPKFELKQTNDIVCSVLAEISNIISGTTTIVLTGKGYNCDITTPTIISDSKEVDGKALDTKLMINTPIGEMMIGTHSLY